MAPPFSDILAARTTENVLELVYFEDLPLGGEWSTRRRTITSADLTAFVGLSGDHNPLYTDVEHARSSHFGEIIVPGALLAAVVGGLGAMDAPVPATVGLVGLSWNFMHPVRLGDTIGSHWRLNRKRPVANAGWGLAVWQVEVVNQHGTVVATGEVTRLVNCREQPVATARSGRRRRRKAPDQPPASTPMPSKPMPGALLAPMTEPAPTPVPSEATEPPPEPVTAPAPSRRRRRSRGGGQAPAQAEPPAEPPAEPAGATPPPPEQAPWTPPAAAPAHEPWVPPTLPRPGVPTKPAPWGGEVAGVPGEAGTGGTPETGGEGDQGDSGGGLAGVFRRLRGS